MVEEMGGIMDGLYYHGLGYLPLVLTKDWQLAQLNYAPAQDPDALTLFDQHTFTDETFTLLQGRSLLITYDEASENMEITPLEPLVTYNVPEMMWHNIAMEPGSVVLITEGRDAHLKGCNHIPIPQSCREQIIAAAQRLWGTAQDT